MASPESFVIYDLETSDRSAQEGQIVQYASVRTDLEFNPIEEPINVLIKPNDTSLWSPEAVLVHGITPQKALKEGMTEKEFLDFFHSQINIGNTIYAGFNNISFDNDFMRFLHYRNYRDAYDIEYDNGNSKFDFLPAARMQRAVRPDGVEWPFKEDGTPVNTLVSLTEANNITHDDAHDAESDVLGTKDLAKLLSEKQKLMAYLLENRHKGKLQYFFNNNKNFLYADSRVPKDYMHVSMFTTLVALDNNTILAYDLRHDPTEFLELSVEQLAARMKYSKDSDLKRLPVQEIKLNKCPAVVPAAVAKEESVQENIKFDYAEAMKNYQKIVSDQADFTSRIINARDIIEKEKRTKYAEADKKKPAEALLYSKFVSTPDSIVSEKIRRASPDEIISFGSQLSDSRLKAMLPRYKARNFPKSLTSEERSQHDEYVRTLLLEGGEKSKFAKYQKKIGQLMTAEGRTLQENFLLNELKLYYEATLPLYEDV